MLRVALSLSALYGIPIKIKNIRAGRPKPGLAAQHLKGAVLCGNSAQCLIITYDCIKYRKLILFDIIGVELIKEMFNAQVSGGYVGSTCLEFHPGPLNNDKKEFVIDIGTAGCICLLAQVALPCALFFPCRSTVTLILKGGTNVPMGPQIEYLTEVFKPMLKKFGADFDFIIVRRYICSIYCI